MSFEETYLDSSINLGKESKDSQTSSKSVKIERGYSQLKPVTKTSVR